MIKTLIVFLVVAVAIVAAQFNWSSRSKSYDENRDGLSDRYGQILCINTI